ncbi:hypothetical protein C7974DRAFT_449379 [Boeremia exigua]|uniref:uncharacterized protein n=1 Tax=Boeremia exigua TaxID=749465 RepID=UPI001E8D02D6|nr:uncharacterized protein C7974DRAFT_449379 [Boeremia exigua]KAH6639299.1 hypothetical protein C7974DRAFT_449379 [Boeremia exigua]
MPKVEVRTYTIPPTPLIPNSPHVLIHYPALLLPLLKTPSFSPTHIYDLFARNGWQTQWIARYGPTQASHYHSGAHEAMAVISGSGAKIRFGVADSADSPDEAGEPGGVLLEARLGDVFIVPAGVAHKTHEPSPPTDGMRFLEAPDRRDEVGARSFFGGVVLEGDFMMMGAYPKGDEWDFKVGGEDEGRFGEVWGVQVPGRDPVLGMSGEGLRGLWKVEDKAKL